MWIHRGHREPIYDVASTLRTHDAWWGRCGCCDATASICIVHTMKPLLDGGAGHARKIGCLSIICVQIYYKRISMIALCQVHFHNCVCMCGAAGPSYRSLLSLPGRGGGSSAYITSGTDWPRWLGRLFHLILFLKYSPYFTMIKKDLKKCKKCRILMLKLHDLAYTYL